jgi:hypothetical protein
MTIRYLLSVPLLFSSTAAASLFCTPSTSVADRNETVHIKTYDSENSRGAKYEWTVSGGKLQSHGADADWTFSDVQPSTVYSLKVVMTSGVGATAECKVEVSTAGSTRGLRETARTLLPRGAQEEAGFGLYSYLLLGARPDNNTRERYLAVIKEYLRLCPALADMKTVLAPKQLNANYLPVMTLPGEKAQVTPEWLLTNYDFTHARAILSTVPGSHLRGPYILSVQKPVDPRATASGPQFFQDLSTVPLDLVTPWYEAFLNQAAQERFSEPKTGELFALKLRTMIGVLAQGLPDVKSSMASWIQWLK